METTILELITKYGLNTFIIASLVFVLTGLIKKPIKCLAKKMKDGTALTRYITFLPVIFSFGITVLYMFIINHNIIFNGKFFTLWLTSSSLSLALYAFKEKFLPSKNKILTETEVKQNEELIEKIKETVLPKPTNEVKAIENIETEKPEEKIIAVNVEGEPIQKIILRGNKSGQSVDIKKE